MKNIAFWSKSCDWTSLFISYSPLVKELKSQTKLIKDQKRNYVDPGLHAIFGNQTILEIKNKLKELGNFDMIDFSESDLPVNFLSNIFNGKKELIKP